MTIFHMVRLEEPLGWQQVSPKVSKEEVLKYIKEVWTDMRPKSLRIKILILN